MGFRESSLDLFSSGNIIITLDRACRNSATELAALQLIDDHISEKDAVVNTDVSVHRRDRSTWGFLDI